jgi:hypothetical protein
VIYYSAKAAALAIQDLGGRLSIKGQTSIVGCDETWKKILFDPWYCF